MTNYISSNHQISIFVNGGLLELNKNNDLNLRMNNVVFNPEKSSTTQAEYSFEFTIPATPNNNKILNYANVSSKLNRFNTQLKAEVYADGALIFEGNLTLSGYSDKKYTCNLVSVKVYSLEDIFGKSTLTDLKWQVPYNGIEEQNKVNRDTTTKYYFPLVSYGVFEKDPYHSDDVANDYTSKFQFDKWNRWYYSTFYPSLNALEVVKRCFEQKGYTVGGTAYDDPYLTQIFMSTNLADGQVPAYNYGHPYLGQCKLSVEWANTNKTGYEQELNFKYFHSGPVLGGHFGGRSDESEVAGEDAYNLSSIDVWNMMDVTNNNNVNVTPKNDRTYMWDKGEGLIVIPADGFYKIDLNVKAVRQTTSNLVVNEIRYDKSAGWFEETGKSITPNTTETCPIEIQLIKNYADNIELIKGKKNKQYSQGLTSGTYEEWLTCFPHEDLYTSQLPTAYNDLVRRASSDNSNPNNVYVGSRTDSTTATNTYTDKSDDNRSFGGRRAPASTRTPTGDEYRFGGGHTGSTYTTRDYDSTSGGYIYKDNEIMAFDPAISDGFICGFSSFFNGTASVIKNGYSWSKSNATKNEAFYNNTGYLKLNTDANGNVTQEQTTFNGNEYKNARGTYCNTANDSMNGQLSCIVYLKRNDIIELMAVQRHYEGSTTNYAYKVNADISITAFSPRSYKQLLSDNIDYNTPSQFDYDLNLGNFLNDETTMQEFVQNIMTAFNLELIQEGKNVWLNTRKLVTSQGNGVVDVDNRVNTEEANTKTTRITYPKTMAVQYKIDTDEWGYEQTVPESHINDSDWAEWGDKGYDVIKLDELSDEDNSTSTNFSYTWYSDFINKEVTYDDGFRETGNESTISLPVISKSQYMVDGYSYDDSMKEDGFGQPQRFWFRGEYIAEPVYAASTPNEEIDVYVPTNYLSGYKGTQLNLSYKINEVSLLTEYFNVTPYLSSNYVEIQVYLTPEEYYMLKNGAYVHFDSDLYIICEISGYDPSGNNPTTLKIMKKV